MYLNLKTHPVPFVQMERIGLIVRNLLYPFEYYQILGQQKVCKKVNDFQFALNITMCEITRTNIVFFFTDGVMIHNAKEK